MNDLDIIIVNHRTPELMKECVESIERYMPSFVDYKVFTIDNSPAGETVGEYVVPNEGYAKALHYGVRLGQAPYLLLLNADVKMRPDSDAWNCLSLLQDPQIAIVGPKQVSHEGWIASAGCPPVGPEVNGVGYIIRGWKEIDHGQYNEDVLDCKYVAGSVVFTRRDVWESLGGFLDEVFLYYEETYYCYLARHRGYRCVYTGKSVWTHHWDSSPKDDQHMLSGRPIARQSHEIFARRLREQGVPDREIPAFV